MYRDLRITICFPCRNEADHLEQVLAMVPDFVDEIIVISNNSTDETLERARELGVRGLEDNRTMGGIGYGYAHMTGIENATGDIIVGADGDATYPVENLDKIIDHMLKKKLDFVSCNRYPLQKGTKIPLILRMGVGFLNNEVRFLYGTKINDILSGMWVFKADLRDKLNLTMGDWNICPEIKINAMTDPSIRFGEYPISQHRRLGQSHQHYFKTGFSHATWILKYRLLPRRASNEQTDTATPDIDLESE